MHHQNIAVVNIAFCVPYNVNMLQDKTVYRQTLCDSMAGETSFRVSELS